MSPPPHRMMILRRAAERGSKFGLTVYCPRMRCVLACLVAACSGGGTHVTTSQLPPPAMSADAAIAGLTVDAPANPGSDAAALAVSVSPADIKAVTDPRQIKGSVYVLPQGRVTAKGAVTSVAGAVLDAERVRWTLVVPGAQGDATVTIYFPSNVALPVTAGTRVEVQLDVTGGGPNQIAQLRILDEHGGLLVGFNAMPDGWASDFGRTLKRDKGDTYDEVTHAAKIGPAGKQVELTGDWSIATIAGARFFGRASAVKRNLHGKHAPPDYVGAWIDYTLVRLP
jgi:hypothetical protein